MVYEHVFQNIISSDNQVYAIGETNYPNQQYRVTLEQSIFNYGNWENLRRARAEVRQSNAVFEAAKQEFLLRVTERYFTALAALELAEAARAESRDLAQHLDLVQTRQQGGLARPAELSDARARYLQVQARELQAASAVRDALQALKELTGEIPPALNVLPADVPVRRIAPMDPAYWTQMARENNPLLAAARAGVDRARYIVSAEDAELYPSLGVSLYTQRRKSEGTLFGGGSDIQEHGVLLHLDIPLYNGGLTYSRTRQAQSMVGKALADEDQQNRAVERGTTAALDGIGTAAAQVEGLRAAQRAQEEVVEAAMTAYRSGTATTVDLLDAERDLFFARAESTRARYDYALNTLRLRYQVGLLDIADLDEVDRLLVPNQVPISDYLTAPGNVGGMR